MRTVTAFCCESSQVNTVWIQDVQLPDEYTTEEILFRIRTECAEAWDFDIEHIHCMGYTKVPCEIEYWEDIT